MSVSEVQLEAERLVKSGLSVIPIRADGSKAPAIKWKAFQTRFATPEELHKWFRKSKGLAAVAGKVSGNLEILDFDGQTLFDPWRKLVQEQVGPDFVERLPILMTPSGFHIYYRCQDGIERNQKLAQRRGEKGRPELMIKTRGEGGYVLLPESPPECHPSKQPYFLVQGDLTKIPTVSGEERSLLLESARALTEDPEIIFMPHPPGERIGEYFKLDWVEILKPHGWQKVGHRGWQEFGRRGYQQVGHRRWQQVGHRGEAAFWRRPGKKTGISAMTDFRAWNRLYHFSTDGHPFEPDTSYTRFAVYALLNHDGDFNAAAAELRDKGYGHK